jgi:undecaprenyl-diphosphatase
MLEHIFLGIVQGLTEFLPVSSSGHLALFEQILKIPKTGVVFDMILHLGTLLAVFYLFWGRLWSLLLSLFRRDENLRLVGLLVVASVPTALIGFVVRKWAEDAFQSSLAVGLGLLFTGTLLFAVERRRRPDREKAMSQLGWLDAIWVGILQGVAVFPGVSRSGSTISAGLFRGMKRDAAAEFSFILGIPAIIGAAAFEVKDALQESANHSWGLYGAGAIAAFVFGVLSIKWLLQILRTRTMNPFAYYCWALGLLAIIWSFFKP